MLKALKQDKKYYSSKTLQNSVAEKKLKETVRILWQNDFIFLQ